jgi:hypothetical protein
MSDSATTTAPPAGDGGQGSGPADDKAAGGKAEPPANGSDGANSDDKGGDDRGDLGDVDLGDAGKKALADERKAAKAARAAEKAASQRAAELEKQLADLAEANQTEAEKALKKAREEAAEAARAEVVTELHRERLTNALLTAASGKLADPEDAVVHLLPQVEVDSAGQPDRKAIASAVDGLLKMKPHLKANRINGSADSGPRGDGKPAANDMNARLRAQLGRG